jgi:electron transport complex protein RnfG
MREMIKMVVVLTALAAFSGGLLAAIRNGTQEQIEIQQLQFVKGPAITQIMRGASNDPIKDRFKLEFDETEKSCFVGKFQGEPQAVALETYGKGYGGDVGVMVGINVKKNSFQGIWVTTHGETPGMGAKAKEDPAFVSQFKGLSLDQAPFKVTQDGGQINAIGGATITSRAISKAASEAVSIYKDHESKIKEQMKQF